MCLQHRRIGGLTINHIMTNISFLEKSSEAKFSRCKKDEEVGSSRKIHRNKGKAPMDDLDSKALEPGGII